MVAERITIGRLYAGSTNYMSYAHTPEEPYESLDHRRLSAVQQPSNVCTNEPVASVDVDGRFGWWGRVLVLSKELLCGWHDVQCTAVSTGRWYVQMAHMGDRVIQFTIIRFTCTGPALSGAVPILCYRLILTLASALHYLHTASQSPRLSLSI